MPLAHLERLERELYHRGYGDGRERAARVGAGLWRDPESLLLKLHASLSEAYLDAGKPEHHYHEGWVLGWQDGLEAWHALHPNVTDLDAYRQRRI